MLRHKWKDNECVKCKIFRERSTLKIRMAINHNIDHYKYETKYKYFLEGGKETWLRPECWTTRYDD